MNTGIIFKEWLPDQADLGNPGLITADNVLPVDGSYAPANSLTKLSSSGFTLPSFPRGAFVAQDAPRSSFPVWFYAATSNDIYEASLSGGVFNSRASGIATLASSNDCSFAQYDNLVFAARGTAGVMYHTVGSASNFATVSGLTGSRDANYVSVVGQFVVVGNLGSSTARAAAVAWSAIDDPLNWPTPGSASAIAAQSGEQLLNISDGDVVGVFGHDQHAVIVQRGAITRMTYIGPPAVFQFDRIEVSRGCDRLYGSAAEGRAVHLLAADGFYKTDGVDVVPTGSGKVDKTYLSLDAGDIIGAGTANAHTQAAFDQKNNCVVWSHTRGTQALYSTHLLYMSCDDGRWASVAQSHRCLVEPSPSVRYLGLFAFNSSNILCTFAGAPGTAVIETGEMEFNQGGRAFISDVKPHVESSGTPPTVTVAVGYRDALSSSMTYTSETSQNSRTGFANFRVDAKYARIRTTIAGAFEKATGVEVIAKPAGMA